MLINKYRLRSSKKIARVFKFGKCIYGQYIFIKYHKNNKSNPKIAISISTKLFKQATKRNRIKRLIRESLKLHLEKLPSLDILIIAKKELPADVAYKVISTDISNIFNKLTHPKH